MSKIQYRLRNDDGMILDTVTTDHISHLEEEREVENLNLAEAEAKLGWH